MPTGQVMHFEEVKGLLQDMVVACPVGCRVSISMNSENTDDPLILQWDWKSHHVRIYLTPYDYIRGVRWDFVLEKASKEIRAYIQEKSKTERQVTNGKEENRSERE